MDNKTWLKIDVIMKLTGWGTQETSNEILASAQNGELDNGLTTAILDVLTDRVFNRTVACYEWLKNPPLHWSGLIKTMPQALLDEVDGLIEQVSSSENQGG